MIHTARPAVQVGRSARGGLEFLTERGYSQVMSPKRLTAAMLSAIFALVVAAQPLRAQPPKQKACCGPSCPDTQPKKAPACCEIVPAQAPVAAVAAPVPPLVVIAMLPCALLIPFTQGAAVLSVGSDRSPPQRQRLAPSGLSPPSLA